MSDLLPTTMIKTDNGNVRINLSDYSPEIHTLADGVAAPVVAAEPAAPVVAAEPAAPVVAAEPAAPVVAPEPITYGVQQFSTKFCIINAKTGKKINNDKYDTSQAAWDAVLMLGA